MANTTTLIDYNGGLLPIYIGNASPGTAASATGWQIQFLTYDGNNDVTAVQWANGASSFTNIWNNRASYTYS